MLVKVTERDQPALPAEAGSPIGHFARDPAEFTTRVGTHSTLIHGGQDNDHHPETAS